MEPPYSWENLQRNVYEKKDLQRTTDIQELYVKRKRYISDKYVTYGDYIQIEYLKYLTGYTIDNKIMAIYPKNGNVVDMVLTPNVFPYNVMCGIYHYIIWSNKYLSDYEIKEYLNSKKININDVIYYVNDKQYQSIPSVWHMHLFSKKEI